MVLNNETIKNTAFWTDNGFELPKFDHAAVVENTRKAPIWVHFGAGNIFRAFPAAQHQKLLDEGLADTGIIVAESYDTELIEKAYRPFDNLSLLAVLKTDGAIQKKIIGSIVESLVADGSCKDDIKRLAEIFLAPSLQIVSFTITEKGYAYTGEGGVIATVTKLLYERYLAGKYPVALVSMDNCSHNGDKLLQAIDIVARRLVTEGTAEKGFVDYINDKETVSFPWTMIDKITPRPDEKVRTILCESGFEDGAIFVTNKNTYASAFVNAEEAQYLAIEDYFPNGRPPLEKAGIIMTDRETVNKIEKMKVCTCLNPLHTALSIFGCLFLTPTIWEAMNDGDLKRLVRKLGYEEGMKVVTDPGIINPLDFINEVLEVRFPNPFVPDTPQRIAVDSSQKIFVRFGETIKAYIAHPELDVSALNIIPFVFAGWCRYMIGIDDNGNEFPLNPDPQMENSEIWNCRATFGNGDYHALLQPVLSNPNIFGADLYEIGLGEKTESFFAEMMEGNGAVRKALSKL